MYTVQATVTDSMGRTITAGNTVAVARAARAFAGAVDASAEGDMGEEPLALFTLPQGYSSSGPLTATADWATARVRA